MDDLDLDLKATEPDFRPERTLPPPALFTPLPIDLFEHQPGPPIEEPLPEVGLTVTESRFRPSPIQPRTDAGSHSKVSPLPADVQPPEQRQERRPRSEVALPRLREAIRSPDEVARAREARAGPGFGAMAVAILAVTGCFLAATPAVVWLALSHAGKAEEVPAAVMPAQDELMGIPVRQDLNLPPE